MRNSRLATARGKLSGMSGKAVQLQLRSPLDRALLGLGVVANVRTGFELPAVDAAV